MTLAISLHSSVDLVNIAKFITINEIILGLKFKMGDFFIKKGICNNKNCFANQVTLILNLKEKKVNVKIFSNGRLHITGCTSKDNALEVKKLLEEEFNKITKNILCKSDFTIDPNGILLAKSDENTKFIYSRNYKCIGIYIKDDQGQSVYIIKGSDRCYFNKEKNALISQKNNGNYTYSIFDLDGNKIGEKKLCLFSSKKVFYKNKSIDVFYDPVSDSELLISGKNVIGKYIYDIYDSSCDKSIINSDNLIWITENKDLKNFDPEIYSAMFSFNLGISIDRQLLFKKLIENGYITKFDPNKYSGVNWSLKLIKENEIVGKCDCKKKCICNTISIMIFQSGNVICSGIKNEDNINLVHSYINSQIKKFNF